MVLGRLAGEQAMERAATAGAAIAPRSTPKAADIEQLPEKSGEPEGATKLVEDPR